MRIHYDHQIFSLQAYGGISRYFTRLAQELWAEGQQVEVRALRYQNCYLREAPPALVNGRYQEYRPRKATKFFSLANQVATALAVPDGDIWHETFYPMFPATTKAARVTTVHDMIHEIYPDDFPWTDATARFKRNAVARADHVICVSANTRKDLMERYGVAEDKISVIHLGVDIPQARAADADSRSGERPYLLYVGMRTGYKNYGRFLAAFAASSRLLRDFDVVAFGGGSPSQTELALQKALGFKPAQVRYLSGADSRLRQAYEGAHAFVYPSLYEGFGIPPLEAMAYGCPVLSSNRSSLPEVLGGAAEYFDPEDIESQGAALEKVAYSEERANELRRLGQTHLTQFSWQRCAHETLQVYERLQ